MHRTDDLAGAPWHRVWLVAALSAWLVGCATQAPKDEAQPGATPSAVVESVDPDVRADFEAAMKVLNAQNYEKGIELLSKLTERAKSNTAPYINLAIAHQKLGNLSQAEDNLKKALNLNPDHPVANNEYGLVYRKTGRFSEARQAYERALDKFPSFLPARKNLAILCDLYLKDLECALKNYQLYQQAVPDDKAVEIWIADLQTRLKR